MSGRDFAGSVIVVTGASTGLGRAIAVETAGRGAQAVIINYANSAAEADETARMVIEAGAEAVLVKADVGQDEGCKTIVEAAAWGVPSLVHVPPRGGGAALEAAATAAFLASSQCGISSLAQSAWRFSRA